MSLEYVQAFITRGVPSSCIFMQRIFQGLELVYATFFVVNGFTIIREIYINSSLVGLTNTYYK